MRNGNIRRGTGVAIAALLAGCSLFIDTSDLATGTTAPPDASGSGSDAGFDASVADAVVLAPSCDAHVSGTGLTGILPLDPRWTLRGIARTDELGVSLTAGELVTAGAMWWAETTDLDRFDVASVLRMRPGNTDVTADGIAFAWIRGAVPHEPTDKGGSLGLTGFPGYAVAINVLNGHVDAAPSVEVFDTTQPLGSWKLYAHVAAKPVLDNVDHVLRVRNEGGTVTAWVDGEIAIENFTIPGYASVRGTYGFAAATGGGVFVSDVTRASFRTEPCR